MGGASVQFMITAAMREVLTTQLQFFDEEVDEMKPELAAKMIETGTTRPFGERAMPESWKRGNAAEKNKRGGILGVFKNINALQSVIVGGIAVLTGRGLTKRIELETLLGGASTAMPKEKLSSHVKKKKKKKGKKKKKKKKTYPNRTNVVEN